MLIQADLHCHSLASSHAYSTVDEMAAAARRYGLKAFALTDMQCQCRMHPMNGIFIIFMFCPRR